MTVAWAATCTLVHGPGNLDFQSTVPKIMACIRKHRVRGSIILAYWGVHEQQTSYINRSFYPRARASIDRAAGTGKPSCMALFCITQRVQVLDIWALGNHRFHESWNQKPQVLDTWTFLASIALATSLFIAECSRPADCLESAKHSNKS